jgi:hypothetical protein
MSWLSKTCKKLKKLKLKDALPVIAAVTALVPGVGTLGKGATAAIGTALGAVKGVASLGTTVEQQAAATGGPLVAGAIPKKIKTWMFLAVAALLAFLFFQKKRHHSGGNPGHHSSGNPGHGSRRAVQLANLARGRAKLARMRAAGTVPHRHRKARRHASKRSLVIELPPRKRGHRHKRAR